MVIREVLPEEQDQFNRVVKHPLQTWEWGDFRAKTGLKVIRLGLFEPHQGMIEAWQLTVHQVPVLGKNILYFPKGPKPTGQMIQALQALGQKHNAILVKLEPNLGCKYTGEQGEPVEIAQAKDDLIKNGCRIGRPLFTRFTFCLDLEKSEEELLAGMKPKTRYNVRLAQKHGVVVQEENTESGLEKFINLHFQTTTRQGFFSHSPNYYRQMQEVLARTGMEHVLIAYYQNRPLAAQIFFKHQQTLYYPYGSSTRDQKEVMAPYAVFWKAIQLGKAWGCTKFDMWGTPGPNPKANDPWLGFHRFKEGFGAYLYEFLGTYDLVIDPRLYLIYNLANEVRWKALRLKARFGK